MLRRYGLAYGRIRRTVPGVIRCLVTGEAGFNPIMARITSRRSVYEFSFDMRGAGTGSQCPCPPTC